MTYCNQEVQTVMFSATMGKDLEKLVNFTTKKPIRISADPDNKTAEKLHQQVVKLREDTEEHREATLLSVLKNLYKERVIVFFKTKRQCHRMAIILGLLGLKACELHGNLSQTQRIQAFMDFKEDKYQYLLATDLAARGLDIKEVKTVVNYELPKELTKYIHRIGRTARAGSVGTSLTLCNDEECL